MGELRRGGPRALLTTLGALAALAPAGCGSDEQPSVDAPGVGKARAGSVAAFASCSDWRQGSVAERLATIEDLRTSSAREGGGDPVPSLPDDDAYDLFERVCANDYAAGFKLYKVYARGAAFKPLEP